MNDYILLMHNDGNTTNEADWDVYITRLNQSGNFQGGSSIGSGVTVSVSGDTKPVTAHLSGYIKITANALEHAKELVKGNPVFEAGGTVEIRELPKS